MNLLGPAAWAPVLMLALPAAVAGLMVRAVARRRSESLAMAVAARRRVGDVRAGLVAIEGTWRAPRGGGGGGDGLVEDASGAAVLVTREEGADAIADGAPVLVIGCAGAEGDDPRGSGYRGHARLPRVIVGGVGHLVSTDRGLLERELAGAKRRATAGAALFAAAVCIATLAATITWRAQ